MDGHPRARGGDGSWRLGGLAILLAVLAYLGALSGPFVYDDHLTVVENTSIREPAHVRALLLQHRFRPLVNLSYALDHAWWGLVPFGYHVTSLAFHALNVGLLFGLTRRLVEDARAPAAGASGGEGGETGAGVAFLAAALFAVHPVMTEAVSYVSGRAEVLCAAFFLLGLLAVRRRLRDGRAGAAAIALGAFALALAAKEVALVLPLVALAYDRLLLGGPAEARARRLWRWHVPFVGLVAAAALVRMVVFTWIEPQPPPVPWWRYGLIELVVIWRYVGLLLAPVSQSIVHPVREVASLLEPAALVSAAGLAVLAVAAWRARHRVPLAVFGLAWFFLALAPSSSVLPLNQAMAEHRVYLASAGFFVAVAVLGSALGAWLRARGVLQGPAVPRVATMAVVAVLFLSTVARNLVWADPVALWQEAALRAPETWVPHYGLGEELRARGRCQEAVPAYERARQLNPREPLVSASLGVCLMTLGRLDEAGRALQSALRADAGSARIHNNLGVLALLRNDPDEARRQFHEALARDARHVQARRNLAALYETTYGDRAEALRLCREIQGLAPGTPGVDDCVRRNAARGAPGAPGP